MTRVQQFIPCVAIDPSFLRDLHNDFHSGLSSTFLDMICGVPEVDAVSQQHQHGSTCNSDCCDDVGGMFESQHVIRIVVMMSAACWEDS